MTQERDGVEAVLGYWLDTVGPDRWYAEDAALDAEIAGRFTDAALKARAGGFKEWQLTPRGSLALIVLLDQMHRNIWRGRAEAFAGDARALTVAKRAIHLGQDLKTPEPGRQFFYLPLMHAECLMEQDRCVRLVLTRLPETGRADNLPHAIAHRDVIRKFGRFPFRNAALSRTATAAETAWLAAGGYAA